MRALPRDVTYSIIDANAVPGVKRSIDVRLSRKVSEDVLRTIAAELKSQDTNSYKRTFICYYLPNMTVGAGAWATTHFDPDLKVNIQGLTVEDEKRLTQETSPESREVLGRWLDESPVIGGRITIYNESGKFYFEQVFARDGTVYMKEVIETKSQLGRRFDKVGSRAGDHWVLDSTGNLQIRDNEGLIATAKKID